MKITSFSYRPSDSERESASVSYLISLLTAVAGMPLPIVNLITTIIFYFANRKKTLFVRWHCTQALIAQFSLFAMNTIGLWWTIGNIVNDTFDKNFNYYVAYILTVIVVNIAELIVTIITAVHTRQGKHVKWFFYGALTDVLLKVKDNE